MRIRVDLRGLAQVFQREVVLPQRGCRIAGYTQRRRAADGVTDAFLHFDRRAQRFERALQVADAEIQTAERGQLKRLLARLILRGIHLQRIGVQLECAIEIAERDETEAVIVEQRRVQGRLKIALDQRQQLRVLPCGLGDEAECGSEPRRDWRAT